MRKNQSECTTAPKQMRLPGTGVLDFVRDVPKRPCPCEVPFEVTNPKYDCAEPWHCPRFCANAGLPVPPHA